MSWVRLDDGAPGHRKIVGLSDAAFRLWVVGLTYCNQQANDGRFSVASARIMSGYLASPDGSCSTLKVEPISPAPKHLAKLAEVLGLEIADLLPRT